MQARNVLLKKLKRLCMHIDNKNKPKIRVFVFLNICFLCDLSRRGLK